MSLAELPTELLLNIFRQCTSISSAINLSLTCRRLHDLLLSSQKISVLFAIAERVWGPLDDIFQLLTYNATQAVHVKRTPVLSFALLVQVSGVGRVAEWFTKKYPMIKWDGEDAQLRRELTIREKYKSRRAVYRMWLFDKAFHTSGSPRTMRLNPQLVQERCALLRNWSTGELMELEDLRGALEGLIGNLCPGDGEVYWRNGGGLPEKADFAYGRPSRHYAGPNSAAFSDMFHDSRTESLNAQRGRVPASQLREQNMTGWGDYIEQYTAITDLLKLNPAQIMYLYDNAVTKQDVATFVEDRVGSSGSGGDGWARITEHGVSASWFWNNGETMLHTWAVVLAGRGVEVQEVREKVKMRRLGIAIDLDAAVGVEETV